MATPQENLLDWLRDAHAMEQQAEKMLKAHAQTALSGARRQQQHIACTHVQSLPVLATQHH